MGAWQDRVEVVHADARDFVSTLAASSVDLALCDAPYGLGLTKHRRNAPTNWDASGVAFDPAFWTMVKASLKTGSLLLAMGHPRTAHVRPARSTPLASQSWTPSFSPSPTVLPRMLEVSTER